MADFKSLRYRFNRYIEGGDMGKGFLFLLLFIVGQSSFAKNDSNRCVQKIVVLIPGFFNLPGVEAKEITDPERINYFSNHVLQTIENQGFKTIVFKNLDPVGGIEANGNKTLEDLNAIANKYKGCELNVIAHSAGGLYTAHALTKNPSLPIVNVVTISTPYQGAKILELITWIPGWKTVARWLNLKSIIEFDTINSESIVSQFRVPESVRWMTIAGAQTPCLLLSCTNPQKLSWLLSVAWSFSDVEGDGVISVDSATLANSDLTNEYGEIKTVESWPEVVSLEHWEQVLDPNLFKALGVTHVDWISEQQEELFTRIVSIF